MKTRYLTEAQTRKLSPPGETEVVGVSAISCWEIAKLVEYGRLELSTSLDEWFDQASGATLACNLLALTPEIAIESTRLPGEFHRDPADQIIVATARVYGCSLVTSDEKIVNYPHVMTIR